MFRALYEALLEHEGPCFATLLVPWLAEHGDSLDWLARVAAHRQLEWSPDQEDLWELYALSRVSQLLLLRFQPCTRGEWAGPELSLEEYVAFVTRLGLRVVERDAFAPFFHEIVSARPHEDPGAPIERVATLWPCTMLGDELLIQRAGVAVQAGAQQLVPAIACGTTLYWAHRRSHRRTDDPSKGWGHNSQWRTSPRRDVVSGGALHFNVDGKWDVREPSPPSKLGPYEGRDDLPVDERIELLVHRSFVRTDKRDDDRWPWEDRLVVPAS